MDLKKISKKERGALVIQLLKEQVIDQRIRLKFWSELTKQSAQIDTGYIGQHLVSLLTGLYGSGMRGKGDDLEDGSEVKSANFIDSLDKRGAIAPRWNFSSNDVALMESYLSVPKIYLVSIDLNSENNFRIRVWEIDPRKHKIFHFRYHEWMEKLGKPKLSDPNRPGVNFQLFPPRFKTDETFARHGNGRSNGFLPVKIQLQGVRGTRLLLHAVQKETVVDILHLETY